MITFVNPKSPFLIQENVMPPLGLMYLVAKLKSQGIAAQIVDMGLGEELPDGELFITGTTPQEEELLKLRRDAYTVLGGPHASVDPDFLAKEGGFDLVVAGEGEEVIEEIVKHRPTGVMRTKRVSNLDALPFPDRSTVHKYNYLIDGRAATTMITSRGCNGKCSFCCKAVMDHGIFLRSAANVIAEVAEVKALGYGAVMFYDDTIAINKKRLAEICDGIGKMDMYFRCFVRSDQVDQDMMSRMAQSGCRELLIGVESGSQRILDSIRKEESVLQNMRAIQMAKAVGIKVKALMMVGLPGETWESVEESRRFIQESRPDSLDVTILSVYKGCDIHANPTNYDIAFTKPTWYKGKQGEYFSTVRTAAMTQGEITEAREVLWDAFEEIGKGQLRALKRPLTKASPCLETEPVGTVAQCGRG